MKIQTERMQAAADRACDLLKAMANRHRLLILCQLVDRERSVGELAEFLGIRDSAVSQHLTLLRKDGLVTARRDGQTIWYSIASPEARTLLSTLYSTFCAPMPASHAKSKVTRRNRPRIERDQ
jgi:ArsR family transcriptional regulator, virulence genes transcriptional regulator